jgi:hypothetical protein
MVFLRLLSWLAHPPQVALGRCVSLLAVLLLTSCASANTGASRATPSSVPAGLAPITTPLSPPPQNCALRLPPQRQLLGHLGANTDVHLVGGGPFWIYGSYQSILHMAQPGSQQWPMTKIVVEVGPNYDQPVTLRLRDIETGTLAWWTDSQMPPRTAVQTLVLTPQKNTEDVGVVSGLPDIPHGAPDPGWKEWGTFPLFSVAGCYALEVSWSGGSWQSNFAVGN